MANGEVHNAFAKALAAGDTRLENVIGVVHNCIGLPDGYRCGIQFRTCSEFQMDQEAIERELSFLEARFAALHGSG